ncbi:hypothetical protein AAVH_25010 [Aphelenchoides avenae]|nr:hypothetical protein AAVH_25010 [Aphelenchus avenae]
MDERVYVRLPSNHLPDARRYEPAVVQAALTNHVYAVSMRDHQLVYAHVSTLRKRHEEHTRPFEILSAADKHEDEGNATDMPPAFTCPCNFRTIHNVHDLTVFGSWLVILDQEQNRHWVSLREARGDWTPLEQLITSLPLESDYERPIQLIEVTLSKKRSRQLIERLKRVSLVKVIIFPLDPRFANQTVAQDFINLMNAFPQLEDAYNLPGLGCIPAHMLNRYTDFSYRQITGTANFTLLSVSVWPSLKRVTFRLHISVNIPADNMPYASDVSHVAHECIQKHLPVVSALRTWLYSQPKDINWHVTWHMAYVLAHLQQCSQLPIDPNTPAHRPFAHVDAQGSVPAEFFPAGHRIRQRLMHHQGYEYPYSDKPTFTNESRDEQLTQQLAWEQRLRA